METKTIFLIFIFGVVAVLAERKSIEESGNQENDNNGENKKEIEVKVHSNDTFKTKEYFDKIQKLSTPLTAAFKFLPKSDGRSNGLWLLTKKLMDEFLGNIHEIFYLLETQITNKKEKYEDSLKAKLEIAQNFLKKQKESQPKKTNKKGKEEAETKKCLEGYYSRVHVKLTKCMESGYNCLDNALEDAKQILEDARNDFNETFTKSYKEIEEKTKILPTCLDAKTRCLKSRLGGTIQKIKEMINATNTLLNKTKEDLKRPNQDMDDCYQELLLELSEVQTTHTNITDNCGKKATLEDDDEEEEKTEDDQREKEEKTEDDQREEESKVERYQKKKAKFEEKL